MRIEIWQQTTNSADRPWRRRHDRKFCFRFVQQGGGRANDWPFVLGLVGRKAIRIRTFYDRHLRDRVVQVYLGTREHLRNCR